MSGVSKIEPDSSIEALTSVKDVAHKVTWAIQKDVQLHDTLKRRVDALSNEITNGRVALDHVASITVCVETLSRRLGFGSHSGINHCRGCVPLKTAAARAALLASQLRSALHMHRLDEREKFYIVTWLELLVHTYVEAFLLDETMKESASTEALVLVSTSLERWTEFTRKHLATIYTRVDKVHESVERSMLDVQVAAAAAAAPETLSNGASSSSSSGSTTGTKK